ncbi:hypothetical protein Daus18300_010607 [Diaporthe australafricana]|uniref:Cytochrome P450 n=1 Tax=Diaporthe australafricana TaxID=127596 RepID=A0ABR3W9K1_9PEZI
MSSPAVLAALGAVASAYVFLWALLKFTQDSREPPAVLRTIPFLSPIFGMMRWSMEFYPHMRKRYHNLPIYTLRIPGARLYVINSLDLIPVVQRQWRTLLFPPIQVKAAKAAMGASDDAIKVLEKDMITDKGFVPGMVKVTHPTMSNGPLLDNLNIKAFEVFDEAMKQFTSTTGTTVNMFEWIGAQIMRATTDAVYGPDNPLQETENLEAWQ